MLLEGLRSVHAAHRFVATDKLTLDHVSVRRGALHHAQRMLSLGLRAGDRVALWAHPHAMTAVGLVGNLYAGLVTVPLNPSVGTRELAHVLGDSSPSLVLGEAPPGRAHALPSEELSLGYATEGEREDLGDAHPALVLYTSGTTGAPKGAVLTRGNIARNLQALASAWDWTREDSLLHALPLFHVHGLVLGLLGPLSLGCSVTIQQRFEPEAVATALRSYATMLFGVPTMYHRLAEKSVEDKRFARALGRPRLLVSGSAPLGLREHQRIADAAGRAVHERYGLTETLINTAVRAGEAPRPGWVGRALDGVELRLVDDQRRPAGPGEGSLGEVCVRGPSVFQGYLGRDEATLAARDPDGWFFTGDLGCLAEDGNLRVVGRRSTDLIKTGGFKVGAGEVEECLRAHPSVREAAVLGLPDEDLGERIAAWVVLEPGGHATGDELVAHVADALGPQKRPRQVRFVDALPRNAMGKVVKATLKAPT
ncbi:MAG: AMP-binding protein [Deltaproteobacteria bacterium]|nr:AMP-binding protein [Deltaproteobacteria bacterium]